MNLAAHAYFELQNYNFFLKSEKIIQFFQKSTKNYTNQRLLDKIVIVL